MGKQTVRFGYASAWLLSLLTIITFIIAILTPPISGPGCLKNCIDYPYLDIISRFPRDYFWIFPAILILILNIVLFSNLVLFTKPGKKVYSITGLSFAVISATLLIADYYIQVSVIQPSLLRNETEGIALLTQYNPHGVFIALEEIGYFLMSLAFFCLFPVFSWHEKGQRVLKLNFLTGFPAILLSLFIISMKHGLQREYYFEIASITICWIEMIIAGIFLGKLYRSAGI